MAIGGKGKAVAAGKTARAGTIALTADIKTGNSYFTDRWQRE